MEPVESTVAYLVNNNLGYCLNQFGQHQEVEQYCKKAITINPQRHNAYKNLGIALEGQSQFAEAAKCYIKAVQMNASDPRALQHLENLVQNQSNIRSEITDIMGLLEQCRKAVNTANDLKKKLYEDSNKRNI